MARCPCARHRQDVTPIDAQQTVHSLGDLRVGLSHLKLSKPAKQRRLSLRDTFKKKKKRKEKLFLQSCSISGTECKFDFPDEAPLLSLAEFIPHPHFSSHLLTSQEFFSPPKRKELLVSMQSSRSTNATLLFFRSMKMKYSWLQRAIFERERRERDEDGEANSCHFDTRLKFSWCAGLLLGHLNSSSTCLLFEQGEQTR